jgi:hypothetical protein
MGERAAFAQRFRLALHALRLSRAAAAAQLQVDKSLVGRWALGTVLPGDHNFMRITSLIAEKVSGFTALDWQRDLPAFAGLLGLEPDSAVNAVSPPLDRAILPLKCLALARDEGQRRGHVYEGFWRTTRPSMLMRDKVFHDYGVIRMTGSGLLEVTMGGAGLGFEGWAFPLEGNLFAVLDQAEGFTPMFLIFRGVPMPKATVLEGIALMAALDSGRTPAAFPLVLERIGDLSGDPAADEQHCRNLASGPPHEDASVYDPAIREVLFRQDFSGDPLFLVASAVMSRGTTRSGGLEG